MKTFSRINNVTYEGYDFTESYIESFSLATLQAGFENNLLEAAASFKASTKGTNTLPLRFSVPLPDDLVGAAEIAVSNGNRLVASVDLFSARELVERAESDTFGVHRAIAFPQFEFDVLGAGLVERKLEGARLFIRDGFADQMFVSMYLKENPEALAA